MRKEQYFQLADEMMNGAKSELNRVHRNKPIDIEAYKESRDVARDNASGIMYDESKNISQMHHLTELFMFPM